MPRWIDFHHHVGAPSPPDAEVWRINSIPVAAVRAGARPEAGELWTLELHPWTATEFPEDFAAWAAEPFIAGVGEVGMDRHRGVELTVQQALFEQAAAVATAVGKPLTIHCVGAYSELLALGKHRRWPVPTLVHYFCGKPELAEQLWHCGWTLSLPPAALRNVRLMAYLRAHRERLPQIVLETDAPGGGDIVAHYEALAAALALSVTELSVVMNANFRCLYGLRVPMEGGAGK